MEGTLYMDLFETAKVVKLQSPLGKYLHASANGHVIQHDDGGAANVHWIVEVVGSTEEGGRAVRLMSYFGRYLTRTQNLFFSGTKETYVMQTTPYSCNPFVNWAPVRPPGCSGTQLMFAAVTPGGCVRALRGGGRRYPYEKLVTTDDYYSSSNLLFMWHVHVVETKNVINNNQGVSHGNLPRIVFKPQINNNVAAPNSCLVNAGQNINGSGEQKNGDAVVDGQHEEQNSSKINNNVAAPHSPGKRTSADVVVHGQINNPYLSRSEKLLKLLYLDKTGKS